MTINSENKKRIQYNSQYIEILDDNIIKLKYEKKSITYKKASMSQDEKLEMLELFDSLVYEIEQELK